MSYLCSQTILYHRY